MGFMSLRRCCGMGWSRIVLVAVLGRENGLSFSRRIFKCEEPQRDEREGQKCSVAARHKTSSR